jgi:hypothetical protein
MRGDYLQAEQHLHRMFGRPREGELPPGFVLLSRRLRRGIARIARRQGPGRVPAVMRADELNNIVRVLQQHAVPVDQ